MVGLVVVSHSRPLARAAVALAEEMVHASGVRIVIAAGLDETTTGTDAAAILHALTEADDGGGVVVLMDLGSAVLSAELALDLMDDDAARSQVRLCPAPLVEGLVAAAVAAAGGAGLDEVVAEALASLAGKQAHLGDEARPAERTAEPGQREVPRAVEAAGRAGPAEGPETVGSFTLSNPHGLHARPAARLVGLVRGLDAVVGLRNLTTGSGSVAASSLTQVAMLAALAGHEVEVRATGPQAAQAVEGLIALARDGFGEQPQPVAGIASSAGSPVGRSPAGRPAAEAAGQGQAGGWRGIPASQGAAVGPVVRLGESGICLDTDLTGQGVGADADPDPQHERDRLAGAVARVREQLGRLRGRTAADLGETEAAIFDAQLLMLDDTQVLQDVHARIATGEPAALAWQQVLRAVHDRFVALPDPYLQARATDVRAIAEQVLAALLGGTEPVPAGGVPGVPEVPGVPVVPGVLVAGDLTPAEAAELDVDQVAAVVLAHGSPTSHSAILARARGIPIVVAAGVRALGLAPGTALAVDAATGELVVDPDPDTVRVFTGRAAVLAQRRERALANAARPARTLDDVEVLIGANLGSVDDARAAASSGADLAGLVRTEFLFLGRAQAPDVDEQEKAYHDLADALGGRRLILRTLDVGGDKPLPYLPMPAEANPFLGVRGLRLSLRRPQLLADQLLAMVRVAHEVPVGVMFPMVSTVAELVAARELLAAAIRRDGRGTPAGLQVGTMIEVPAAALKAASFVPYVDFFSIGTNDLTQYALAAERGNDAVATLGDPLDPGVLRLIEAVCRGAGGGSAPGAGGPMVAVCGELAADERATGVLVGLGVRELSVSPAAVPVVKDAVRAVALPAARTLAERALAADGPDAVRALLEG